jgi:hypothetical protein
VWKRQKEIQLLELQERKGDEIHGKREIDNIAGCVDCGETADWCISVSL